MLSDKIVSKTSSITNLKKLLTSPIVSNLSSTGNIWLSNKIYKDKNFIKFNDSYNNELGVNTLFKKYTLDYSFFKNISFYETSIFWVVKRFKFLQAMNTNHQDFEKNNFFKNTNLSIEKKNKVDLFLLYNLVLNSQDFNQSIFDYKPSLKNQIYTPQLTNFDLNSIKHIDYNLITSFNMLSFKKLNFDLNSLSNIKFGLSTMYYNDFNNIFLISTPVELAFSRLFFSSIYLDNKKIIVYSNLI